MPVQNRFAVPFFSRPSLFYWIGVACLLPFAAQAEYTPMGADSVRLGAHAEWLYDSNINRAGGMDASRAESILTVEGQATRSFLLSYRTGAVVRGALGLTAHTDYTDLSHLFALGRVAYRYQPNPSFTGTWLELAGQAEWRRHQDSRLRDSVLGSVSASLGKHVTDRVRLGGGIGHEIRNSREDVYDLRTNRVWATIDYRATLKATVYGSVNYLDGDQVFNTAYGGTQAIAGPLAKALAPDPALTQAFNGLVPVAYRFDAETWSYDLGLNYALSGTRALDFSIGYFDAKADQIMQTYDGTILSLMYMQRFR